MNDEKGKKKKKKGEKKLKKKKKNGGEKTKVQDNTGISQGGGDG